MFYCPQPPLAGIHADGALKDRYNYELYDCELLGTSHLEDQPLAKETPNRRFITTGEYGGLAGFKHVYGKLGITFPGDESAEHVLELER